MRLPLRSGAPEHLSGPPGWRTGGVPADHYLDLGEMLVRNVTTDIRDRFGGGFRIEDGNSIFIFEVAGLCVGHLGHLHHEPSDDTYAAIGRLDVVMAAVGHNNVQMTNRIAVQGICPSQVL